MALYLTRLHRATSSDDVEDDCEDRSAREAPVQTNTMRQNDSRGGWVIQKFGGTSVGKFPKQIAENIVGYVSTKLLTHVFDMMDTMLW
jgi:hypothetical protein